MDDEKRLINGYEIFQSIVVGHNEIVLGRDEQGDKEHKYLCAYCRDEFPLVELSECLGGNDYIDAIETFTSRVSEEVRAFKKERSQITVPVDMVGREQCTPIHDQNISGKILVVNAEVLRPEFRTADKQIVLAVDGFGTEPNSLGTAVFCRNIYAGTTLRYARYEFLGELKKECTPQWVEERASIIQRSLSTENKVKSPQKRADKDDAR